MNHGHRRRRRVPSFGIENTFNKTIAENSQTQKRDGHSGKGSFQDTKHVRSEKNLPMSYYS
jgi:hypothetical protein